MRRVAWVACIATIAACGGTEEGFGSVVVDVDGETASREGWPVTADGETIGFVDGWSLSFDAVVVSLAEFTLATSGSRSAELASDPVVVDLHRGVPTAWTFEDVPARRWDRVSYRYVPPTAASRNVNGVDDGILEEMIAEGATLYLSGTATDGEETVTFAWPLAVRVLNTHCHSGVDDTDGMVVRRSGVSEAQLTIHLDHLFFDTYATDDADMRFEPVAAVADEDGHVTLDALSSQPLADLRDRDGEPLRDSSGVLVLYDPGPLALERDDLREYLLAAATTTGHFQGEGHCDYERE